MMSHDGSYLATDPSHRTPGFRNISCIVIFKTTLGRVKITLLKRSFWSPDPDSSIAMPCSQVMLPTCTRRRAPPEADWAHGRLS